MHQLDQPDRDLLLMATDRFRECLDEVKGTFWPQDPLPRNKDVTTNKFGSQEKCRLRTPSSRRRKVQQTRLMFILYDMYAVRMRMRKSQVDGPS